MNRILISTLAAGAVLCLSSCVTSKNYNSLKAHSLRMEAEAATAQAAMDDLTRQNDELVRKNEALGAEIQVVRSEYNNLQARYDRLLSDGSEEAGRMLREIQANQQELQRLQHLLANRDRSIEDIRRKVSQALLGFEGRGLTVTTQGGKVYVSMDDKLLFRSGSFEIESAGSEAVRELAAVLSGNPDIDVLVEGHTDNVPYRGAGNLSDNLDLSAKRATTVARQLIRDGVAPQRITAAGRGEYVPVAPGDDADSRARNRRTEIILTPQMEQLLQILDR